MIDVASGRYVICTFCYPDVTQIHCSLGWERVEAITMGTTSTNRFRFTKSSLASLEKRIDAGDFRSEVYVYDSISHLAIRIKPGKTFLECVFCLFERIRVHGELTSRQYKRQISKISEARNLGLSLSDLRFQADALFRDIQGGNDPLLLAAVAQKNEEKARNLREAQRSLRDMLYGTCAKGTGNRSLTDSFVSDRTPSKRYLEDIDKAMKNHLNTLADVPLHSISPEQVKHLYQSKIAKTKAQLHNAMRILRSVWNWAQTKYYQSELFKINPVCQAMRELRVNINKTNIRTGRIHEGKFKPYINAVCELGSQSSTYRNARDALIFMLFSGVRVGGTVKIKINDIDLDSRTFKAMNKGGRIIELPLNSVTEAIVRSRVNLLPSGSEYLFPGRRGRAYYSDTRYIRRRVKEVSGVDVTNHDLRRTYKSLGVELNVNGILIDELCGHARGGVDAHYVHPSMKSLREASQKIADYIVQDSGVDVVRQVSVCW